MKRYNFALKTFEDDHKLEYDNEIKAFQALEGHAGIIRYLGDYSQREVKRKKNAFNILLEFGELDLDEFFFEEGRLPPVLPNEVQGFWKDVFEVATAVKAIHLFKRQRGDVSQEYYGWHADIKPDNILRVKGKFKLADPGFATFEKKEAFAQLDKRHETTMIRGGTKTYGAPECHPGRLNREPVPRSIDIWSLGCVFSVAASWVVLGSQGIVQFIKIRQRSISRLPKNKAQQKPEDPGGDYFHTGSDVLQDVTNWHKHLRSTCRKSDTITSSVLDLVDDKMLRGDATKRIDAATLCSELEDILARSEKAMQSAPIDALLDILHEIDDSPLIVAPAPGLLSTGTVPDRKERKSQRLLDLPLMKTTHRSEAVKGSRASARDSFRAPSGQDHGPEEKIPVVEQDASTLGLGRQSRQHQGPPPPATPPGQSPVHQPSSGHSTHQRAKNSSTSIVQLTNQGTALSNFQNVWQARLDIERHEKFFKLKKKDPLLTPHFGTDRDIHFIVDNAESMVEFWDETIYLLETLVMKAWGQDKNGMDLTFANGPIEVKNSNTPSTFRNKMEHRDARPSKGSGVKTDIRKALEEVLYNRYLRVVKQSLQDHKVKVKKLTIIVLTDGKWDDMEGDNDVEDTIVEFAKKLKKIQGDHMQIRQVSFEFVQLGFDEGAAFRLQRLDDELPWRGVPDIVDAEHSRGDVNKMLLGSFNDGYDKRIGGLILVPSTPTNQSDYFDSSLENSQSNRQSVMGSGNLTKSPPQMESPPPEPGNVRRIDTGRGYQMSGPPHQTPSIVVNPEHSNFQSGYRPQ
jgi:serine/threonine protein kinase